MIEILRLEVGDEYTASTEPHTGGGCYRSTASEPGYTIKQTFAPPIFVSDQQLEAACRVRHRNISGNGNGNGTENRGMLTGALERIRGFLR